MPERYGEWYGLQTRPTELSISRVRIYWTDVLFRAFLIAAFLAPSIFGLDVSTLKPQGYVNDFADVIPEAGRMQLTTYLGNVERATGVQMAVVTIPSLEGDDIRDFGIRLMEAWGVGNKNDEGLAVILSIEDHKYDVEVGYGLEPIITDGLSGRVLRGVRPILRQGNYGGALLAVMQQFGGVIAEDKGVTIEGQPPVRVSRRGGGATIGGLITAAIMILFFVSILGGGRGGGPRGGRRSRGANLATAMILGSMLGGGRHRGNWGGGGFGGAGGFGGGGGGGFGGFGGGGFGGGGSSGGW